MPLLFKGTCSLQCCAYIDWGVGADTKCRLEVADKPVLQLSVTKGDRVEAWAHQIEITSKFPSCLLIGLRSSGYEGSWAGKRLQLQSEITGKFPVFLRCSNWNL